VPGKDGLLEEDPQVSAAATLFERRLDAVLPQFVLQLEQIIERLSVVGVDRHPFHTLGLGVDGVDTEGDLAGQVTLDVRHLKAQRPAFPLRAIVVMVTGFSMRTVRLPRVGAAVHKPLCVLDRHLRRCFQQVRHTISLHPFARIPKRVFRLARGHQTGWVLGEVQQPEVPDFLPHLGYRVAAEDPVCQVQEPEAPLPPVVDVELPGPFVAGGHHEQQQSPSVFDPMSDNALAYRQEAGDDFHRVLLGSHLQVLGAEHWASAHTICVHDHLLFVLCWQAHDHPVGSISAWNRRLLASC
jgi:hypothetical protein